MNWKVKAHLLALLSRIPAGRQVYHSLQRIAGTNRLQLDRDLNRAFELIDLSLETGQSLEGTEILEIGTGWRPLVPYVFALAGAKSVRTLDVNPWLTKSYALETWAAIEDRLEEIAARTNVPISDVRDRHRSVDTSVTTLSEFLNQIGIIYHYPGDARETGLEEESIDLIISSNVLEHIPLDVQNSIHLESMRILKTGGVSIHRFNPQDHNSTVDASITHSNFLKFSNRDWTWYGGSGLAYHNRLRSREYRELFESCGFNLTVCRERIDQRSLIAIESGELIVNEQFSQFSPEELAVDYMWVVAEKPARPATVSQNPDSRGVHQDVAGRSIESGSEKV